MLGQGDAMKHSKLLVLSAVGLLTLLVVVFTLLHLDATVPVHLPSSSWPRSSPSPRSSSKSLPESELGFVLALNIMEQFTNAAKDVMSMQCWATSVGLDRVLEPSVNQHSSDVLYFSVDYQKCDQFRDLADIESWNQYSKERHFVPLSSMEEFLQQASRNVIYVEMAGSTVCPKRFTESFSSSERYSFLQSNNFRIVRSVCISTLNFHYDRPPGTHQQFRDMVFGDLDGQEKYTVIFSYWRAVRNGSDLVEKDRIIIQDSPCDFYRLDVMPYHEYQNIGERGFLDKVPPVANLPKKSATLDTTVLKESKLGLLPSKQVLDAADLYRTKCLSNKPYIAVMARTEKVNLKHQHEFTECAQKMLGYVKSGMELYNLTAKVFTSDVGHFGSKTLRKNKAAAFQNEIMKTLSMNHIDDPATGCMVDHFNKGPVRAAWTQSIIVAEARCIVLVGAGAFQLNVLNTHTALYRGNGECFVLLNKYCAEVGKTGFS